jgi:hypothetical protein
MASLMAIGWSAQAATVVNPVDVSLSGADEFFPAFHLIDGSGLDAQPVTGDPLPDTWTHAWGDPANHSWVSTDPGGFPADWFLASGTIPRFVLDLGQDSLLNNVHLWAYSGGAGVAGNYQGNSAKTLEFRFNTQAEGAIDFVKPAVTVTLDHGFTSETPIGTPMPRQDFDVGARAARYVEIRITDNWYVAPGDGSTQDEHGHFMRGGDRIGLGEVRFSAGIIPEPAIPALFAGGLLFSVRWRARKR